MPQELMVEFLDLNRQYNKEKKEINRAIQTVLSSGIYLNGNQVKNFEKEFALFLGVNEAIGVGSGTDALTLSLLSLGIKPGDQVIMPTNVYPSVFGVLRSGAVPLFADVNKESFNLDLQSLKKIKISRKTKAILFVDLYGNPAGVIEVKRFAQKHGLYLIEDASHAHGASIDSMMAGTIGDIGCFSFYPTKNLASIGDAGTIVTNNSSLAKKIRSLKLNGEGERFISAHIGLNTNLDEIHAAVLRVRLKSFLSYNLKRAKIANYYKKLLVELPLTLPKEEMGTVHSWLHFVIQVKKRDDLKYYLQKHNIPSDVHYPLPLHLQPSLAYLGYKKGDFPVSENLADNILSLPLYPFLKKEEINEIIKVIRSFYKKNQAK